MRRLADINKDIEQAGITEHKKRTPEEMLENPMDYIADGDEQDIAQQEGLNDTWVVADGDDHERNPPGSGANEGAGDHDSSINDNDSKNGPVK